jgi:hypothetical protein
VASDATGSNGSGEAAQRQHREELQRKTAAIEADLASGHLTPAQAADAIRAARALYSTASDLAQIEADTGWHCWIGVGGILYARLERTSPPRVVRAPSAQSLREAIEASTGGAGNSRASR